MELAQQLVERCGGGLSEASLRSLQVYLDDIVGGPEDLPDLATTILPILDLATIPATSSAAAATKTSSATATATARNALNALKETAKASAPSGAVEEGAAAAGDL